MKTLVLSLLTLATLILPASAAPRYRDYDRHDRERARYERDHDGYNYRDSYRDSYRGYELRERELRQLRRERELRRMRELERERRLRYGRHHW